MIRRYHITLGATTTAGGAVTSASSRCSINGVRVALEGDQITCPSCQASGVIKCDGARLSEKYDGVQVALENDLCICKCVPPPRLVPNQTLKSQNLTDTGSGSPAAAAAAAAAAVQPSTPAFDEAFQALDKDSGMPLAGLPYRIVLPDGTSVRGRTDVDGKTRRVRTDNPTDIQLFWDAQTDERGDQDT